MTVLREWVMPVVGLMVIVFVVIPALVMVLS